MNGIKVLLVEDELTLSMIVEDTLSQEGFEVRHAANGADGLKLFFDQPADIVVADVMMPQMDGFEMVKKIRQHDKTTPILFLTARSAIKDLVEGFELGANDYLKKPFNMQELIIRIKSLVGRVQVHRAKEELCVFKLGGYTFHSIGQTLSYGGAQEELSHRESELLKRLCMNKNEVLETRSILLELWGDDSFFNTKSLHVFITKLRRKLAKDESIKIINVRGIGYKLIG